MKDLIVDLIGQETVDVEFVNLSVTVKDVRVLVTASEKVISEAFE